MSDDNKSKVAGNFSDNSGKRSAATTSRHEFSDDLKDDVTGVVYRDNSQLIPFPGMYQQDDRDIALAEPQ